MNSERRYTYFISDLHLGARYISDRHAHERHVVNFLRSIEPQAKAVYFLGDVLDFWFEYRTVVPRGFVRFFGELARLADAGVKIVWFTGNHDMWLSDYLGSELGIEVVDTPDAGIERRIDGVLFFLGHGDYLGRQPRDYTFLRAVFRNKLCRKLFSAIHPRWTLPFAFGWSSHSRKTGVKYAEKKPFAVPEATVEAARALAMENKELRYVIIGHLHSPVDMTVTPWCRLIVLGNWFRRSDYAVFDGISLILKES